MTRFYSFHGVFFSLEVSCEQETAERSIRVEGLPNNPEDLMRYGHRLTFSCVDQRLILQGQKEIICQSNGEWSSPFPKCDGKFTDCKQLSTLQVNHSHVRQNFTLDKTLDFARQ